MSETLPSLTANGQKLIDRLLTLPQGWVTAAMLAESIGVSRRTVLRELPSVEQWIAAAGYRFVRSPGQGLLLDEPPARREQMRALLNGSTVYAELPRRQRRQKLLGMLLQAREPMKTAALARELLVSESTLAADLDEIGQWVSSYAVTLHRRPGVGVWLKGEKLSCRRAAAALLQSSLTEEELQAVLRGNFAAGGAFAALLNTKIAERVWQVLQQFEQKEKLRLPDAGFLTGDDGEKWGAGEMHLRHLTGRLISEVERAMRVNFSGYVSLRDNLFTHLRPMLLRVREQIHMDNPQLDTIQREYPQLWAATRAACDTVEMELALPHIPDSEAAYLAMHFGAVLEQNGALRQAARVVVACPLGMSSSRFLASRIEGEFPTLKVDGCCSVRELDPEQLHSRGIDLVIATVPLELAYPSITVNPALLEPDRALLRDAVQRLNGTVRTGTPAEPSAASAAEGGLRYTYRLTRSMVQMLDHLCIRTCKPVAAATPIASRARWCRCSTIYASGLCANRFRGRA